MKIITLIPFKNEAAFLQTSISSVKPFSDEIIVIDDNSTDESCEIAKKLGAFVYNNNDLIDYGWSELSIRRKLLNLGREHGGTHFVCLDADEAISSNFKNNLKIIESLKPGEKILMQWLAMWKSLYDFRDDSSVWSNNFKDFIFFDDGKVDFPDVWMHTQRTPGVDCGHYKIPQNIGAVLHFQFSHWDYFQIKQSWYRCSELIKFNGNDKYSINVKYKITLDDNNFFVNKVKESLISEIIFPELDEIYKQSNWRLIQIESWFRKYGINFFDGIDIWHVKEIIEIKNKIQNEK
jgi:glycosyltransferase involved in cell wall biosynthesis